MTPKRKNYSAAAPPITPSCRAWCAPSAKPASATVFRWRGNGRSSGAQQSRGFGALYSPGAKDVTECVTILNVRGGDIEPGKPAINNRCREAKAHRRARAVRDKISLFEECTQDSSRLAGFIAGEVGCRPTRELARNNCFLKQRPSTARQSFGAHLLLAPNFDSAQQFRGFQQAFHECDLVNAGFEEERAELGKALLGEIATSIQVSAARFVGFRVFDPQQFFGKAPAELAVNPKDKFLGHHRGWCFSTVDQSLHLDMCGRLLLQVPAFRFVGV